MIFPWVIALKPQTQNLIYDICKYSEVKLRYTAFEFFFIRWKRFEMCFDIVLGMKGFRSGDVVFSNTKLLPNWITGQIFIQTTCILNHKFIKFVKFRESRTIEISSFIVKLDPGNSVIKTLLLFCKTVVTHNLTKLVMRQITMICQGTIFYEYERSNDDLLLYIS